MRGRDPWDSQPHQHRRRSRVEAGAGGTASPKEAVGAGPRERGPGNRLCGGCPREGRGGPRLSWCQDTGSSWLGSSGAGEALGVTCRQRPAKGKAKGQALGRCTCPQKRALAAVGTDAGDGAVRACPGHRPFRWGRGCGGWKEPWGVAPGRPASAASLCVLCLGCPCVGRALQEQQSRQPCLRVRDRF